MLFFTRGSYDPSDDRASTPHITVQDPIQSINNIILLLLFLLKVGITPQALRNYPRVCHQSGVSGSRPQCIVQKCPICIFYYYYHYYYYFISANLY